jgi:hypothetical protein
MTRLYIDKREVTPLPANLDCLDDLIQLVENQYLSANMLIQQIQLDGMPLVPDHPASVQPGSLRNQETIEVFTASMRDIAIESIEEATAYLGRIEAATPSLTSSLRTQTGHEVYESLKQFYEGLYWINLLLNRLELSFQIPMAEIKISSGTAQSYCMMLATLLKEVIEAHEKKDFGLLADLLEYEVAPLIPACKEIFAMVRIHILEAHQP